MKQLKFAWLLVVVLVLAACRQNNTPEVIEDITVQDVVNANDVVTNGDTSRVPGYTGVARFYLTSEDSSDPVNGCNANTQNPVRVTVSSSDTSKITIASPGYLEFTNCASGGNLNAKTIDYTINSSLTAAASVTITGTGSGGKSTGSQNPQAGTFQAGSFTVNVTIPTPTDTSPPVIAPTVSGTLVNGWYTSNVTVSWDVTDAQSGIASSNGCDSTTIMTDTAGMTLTCTATNGAGLQASDSVIIKRDATAPAITPDDVNDTTWRNDSLSASFTVPAR